VLHQPIRHFDHVKITPLFLGVRDTRGKTKKEEETLFSGFYRLVASGL